MIYGNIDFIKVDSSVVDSVYYNEMTNVLYVKFVDDSIYLYSGIPFSTYQSFLMSESKGNFINTRITGYPYLKLIQNENEKIKLN